MKIFPITILAFFLITADCPAAPATRTGSPALRQPGQPLQVIKLKDGSTIKGRLVDVNNGKYSIETSTMGLVEIPAAEVASISSAAGENAPWPGQGAETLPPVNQGPSGSIPPQQIQSLQQRLMADPEIKADIQALSEDPEIRQLLGNQDLLDAVFSMDPARMQNDPDFQKILNHPRIQRLIEKITQKLFTLPGGPAGSLPSGY